MKRFGLGVCIGKFLPPHRGHHLLIDTALGQAGRVVVIVCEKETDPIPGDMRADWLHEVHPAADIRVIEDCYDADGDSALWARLTIGWLGRVPDAVFTSESYGDCYSRAMGCAHVLVDQARTRVPCSGTTVRRDPFACWEYLEPPVRAWFARRVCVVGAESTGTTTLAAALAERWQTVWVAEYGREYSRAKAGRGENAWRSEEFEVIAREQCLREDATARRANRLLICDTNAWVTAFWHRRYVGTDSSAVRAIAAACRTDLYLLTGDEIPFVQDGLRDGEHMRHVMHEWFAEALAAQPVPWVLLRGSPAERLARANEKIGQLFRESAWRVPTV
jgi:HTH-type transcriptional repressor of NAD biosynthesis genes